MLGKEGHLLEFSSLLETFFLTQFCFLAGKEGWTPTAAEAKEVGLIQEVVPHDRLSGRAQEVAEQWVREGRERWTIRDGKVDEYKGINARESEELATAFLSYPFLDAQHRFLKSRGKTQLATTFWLIKTLRPLWSRFM